MIIEKPSTAVLMPTFNRPEALQDTLVASLDCYKKFNLDVYVLDSSTDNKSREIVLDLQKKYDNLFYIRYCSFIHLDCKWIDMIQGNFLLKDYNYLYPCGDGNSLTEYSLERIYPYLQENVDIVNICDLARIDKTTEFNNANDFFNHETANIGQWAGAVFNKNRLLNLSRTQWNDAITKWFTSDIEYIGLNGFLLERISLCENLRVVEPSMDGVEPHLVLRRSVYKAQSFWRKDAVKVLAVTYPKVYEKLPLVYSGTKEKIKKLLIANFDFDFFWYLKRRAKFGLKEYLKYKEVFDKFDFKILTKPILLMALLPKWSICYKIINVLRRFATKVKTRINSKGKS